MNRDGAKIPPDPVAGVGPGPQNLRGPVQVPALGQQADQLLGGSFVADVAGMTIERDGVAVQQPVSGTVGEPGGVGGVAEVAEDGVPGAGGHADVVAFPAGVLDQVVRGDVPGDPARAGAGGAEGGHGAVQLAGGIGQGLLKPVLRHLGLLGTGAVARRGGAQQASAQRGPGAEPGCIQRRGEHRPRVRAGGLGVFPAGDQLQRGRQRLGQPIAGRLQRDPQPRITDSGGVRPALLRRAERRIDADDHGQVQHFPFPRTCIGATGPRQRGVDGVPVRPQRADDHRRVRGAQQRPHYRAGQAVLAIQVALQLIQPHHHPREWRLR
jgi:hypothetical protein